MGKCAKCGKKIMYNSWRNVNGEAYCLDCFKAIPKKPKRKYKKRAKKVSKK